VILITYLAVICLDPITPQLVERIKINLLICGENQVIVATNPKRAGLVTPRGGSLTLL